MKFRPAVVLLAVVAPSVAAADVITQTVPFDYDAVQGFAFPVLQGFDSHGGSRELTRVSFEFRHHFALDLYVESTGPTPVVADDFAISFFYISLFQLGMGEGTPFFGPGALSVENASGGMAAYDGIPGNDGPDSYRRTITDALTVVQDYGPADPDVLGAVTDAGAITTTLGGFSESFFGWINDPNWPPPANGFPEYPGDAAVWFNVTSLRHFGEIVVTYEFIDNGPACACDWNASGVLNSQDFFDFLVAFFDGSADFNHDNTTNSQDFFDFLTCFFNPPSGC